MVATTVAYWRRRAALASRLYFAFSSASERSETRASRFAS
jgi:hypothetical protein